MVTGVTRPDAAAPSLLSPRHVRRPRLTKLLDEARGQAIVITAPAGYGKTALAAEWLERNSRVAWFRASPASADLVAFCVGICEALKPIVPHAGDRLRRRVRSGEVPDQSARRLAELLADDLARWPEDSWLVVDDYHLVADSAAVEEFIDWLLTLAPLRLVATTRRRPTWATARRILYSEVTEVTREQLAMTNEEASQVLSEYSDEATRRLIAQAQGWPVLIGLAALSTSTALPDDRISETLFRYFAEEVFRSEPAEVQEFMLAAAVPPGIDAATATELLELEHAEDAVERLEGEGLLQSAGHGSFYFHPLLRDFLLRKLRFENPLLASRLHERAIAAARAAGRPDEAFELATQGGRLDLAADVLAESGGSLLDAGRIETVDRWLGVCAALAPRRPALMIAKAEVLIRQGHLREAWAVARELAAQLPETNEHASPAWHLAARASHLLAEEEQALECHLKAAATARTPHERANALWGAATVASLLEDDAVVDGVIAEMEEIAEGSVQAQLQLISAYVFRGSHRGSLAGIWKKVDPLVPLVDAAPDPMAKGSFFIAGAYVFSSRAHYRAARELIERGLAELEELRFGRIKRAFCLCQLAKADIGLRRFGDAEKALREITQTISETGIFVPEDGILRMKLLLAKGAFEDELSSFDGFHGDPGAGTVHGEYLGLVAIANAAAGREAEAAAAAARAREVSRAIEARFYSRWADMISRLHAEGRSEAVAKEARRLMDETTAADIHDALVLAYRAFPPLLELLAADHQARPAVRALVEAANDHALAKHAGLTVNGDGRSAGALASLTPRENEVLELMAEGLANAEIARRLFISEKTAKVHVYHIFEKLGVATRVQAVLAMRNALAR
jgi:LuxR family maltose regulon positive regulatory protein